MDIVKLAADIATLFAKEDAELSCDYENSIFEVRANGEKNVLVSDDGAFTIPFAGSSVSHVARDVVSYALSVDADAYVAKCVNQGKKHRNGFLAFYDEAVEHSAFALGVGAALAMIGGFSLPKSSPATYSFDIETFFYEGDALVPSRFFFDEKLDAVQIILPFSYRFRRDMRHDFELNIQKKESLDSAALAVGQYLWGDSRDERILKQLMSEHESTATPVLLAAKTWIRAYLGALVVAIDVVEQFRKADKCG